MILLDSIKDVWVANIFSSLISGSLILAVIAWFIKRYVAQQDAVARELEKNQLHLAEKLAIRNENFEKEIRAIVTDCDERSDIIEKNYLKKFTEVSETINRSNKELGSELTKEIREISKEKIRTDMEHIKEFTKLQSKMEVINESFQQIKRVLK